MTMNDTRERNWNDTEKSPWWWVPTLYFAEGVPYFVVNTISVMMFTKMGVPNGDMAFFTTLLYFPWFLKGIWSPIVDVVKTKRWWILSMQALLTVLMVVLTVSLPHPEQETIASGQTPIGMFSFTLILFIIAAFASATHDIAADGFYMLAHSPSSQAAFIGIRSTFYRVASVFGQGVLVFIAGMLEKDTGNIPFSWQVTMGCAAVVFCLITIYHTFRLPRSKEDRPRVSVSATEGSAQAPQQSKGRELADSFITFVKKPGVLTAIAFMLLYRLPEGFLIKMCQPFLVHSVENGGLGLSTEMVGIVYGTIGVIALLAGGIVGGVYACASRTETFVVAHGCLHNAALPHFRLSGRCSACRHHADKHCRIHRAVRLRVRLHGLHALYDVLLRRRVQNVALCHLHRLHGIEHDAAGIRGRLHTGSHRLCQLLLDGDGLLPRHPRRHLFGRPED